MRKENKNPMYKEIKGENSYGLYKEEPNENVNKKREKKPSKIKMIGSIIEIVFDVLGDIF